MTPKQAKANAISQCFLAIADYYEVTVASLMSKDMDRKESARKARGALMFHLRKSGMSYESIGRLVKRSSDSVRVNSKKAGLEALSPEMAMLKSLPSIPNTLQPTNQS